MIVIIKIIDVTKLKKKKNIKHNYSWTTEPLTKRRA